ncbi:hypothetical protein [Variovorax sp. OV700]|uniref:hypothetical protein n=1 Tax=Variovorax sp. OV700 TaxID=1882826 RepID=UPI001C315F7F|nr:hypothetical protein [Variovorax sp. OV700]
MKAPLGRPWQNAQRPYLARGATDACDRTAGAASAYCQYSGKLGPDGVRTLLYGGVNDLGGTLMNESIFAQHR